MEILIFFVAGLLAVPIIGLIYEQIGMFIDRQRYLSKPPGQFAEVNGRRLHYVLDGESQENPMIVLESGAGANLLDWSLVQLQLAKIAPVLAYDRAGFGWSEPSPADRSVEQIADDLHALLQQVGKPPYILVGHSFGGLYLRQFVTSYPDDVLGLILVDASVPAMLEEQDTEGEIGRLKRVQLFKRFGLLRLLIKRILTRAMELSPAERKRYLALALSDTGQALDEVKPVFRHGVNLPDSLGDLPLIVVSRGVTEESSASQRWHDYQKTMLDLSTNSQHLIGQRGSHFVQMVEPGLVSGAVMDMLDQIKESDDA